MVVQDSLSGQKVPLVDPARADSLSPLVWYSCGPTVYDAAHLGHARTYVSLDVLRRAAVVFHGTPVRFLMGVTDVDDKIISRAGTGSPVALAREQEASFFQSMATLGVAPPDALLRVTEHIDDIVGCISELEAAGTAYRVGEDDGAGEETGVYFSVGGFEASGGSYGRLRPAAAGSDAWDRERSPWKRDARDFALWKAAKPGELSWASPWGAGRPGWHIECSAMTLAAAGHRLDLHAGGSDLCFPHHVNEMAQSEAILAARRAAGSAGSAPGDAPAPEWVRAWFHPGPLTVDGQKMSKSLKNFTSVDAFVGGCAPGAGTRVSAAVAGRPAGDVFRLFCLRHPYRSAVSLTDDAVVAAAAELGRWTRFLDQAMLASAEAWGRAGSSSLRPVEDADVLAGAAAELRAAVAAALGDDLDTPRAMAHVARCVDTGLRSLHGGGAAGAAWALSLAAVVRAVAGTLADLGFASARPAAAWQGPLSPRPGVASDEVDPSSIGSALPDLVVGFRRAVRDAAMSQGGSAAVLRVCDAMRDDLGPRTAPSVDLRDGVDVTERAREFADQLAAAGQHDTEPGPPQAGGDEAHRAKQIPAQSLVHPSELFLGDEKYGRCDHTGIPLELADGTELSRSQRNKLKSLRKKHFTKWARGRSEPEVAEAAAFVRN